MKIVPKSVLLTCLSGTLFQTYEPQIFGPLQVFEGPITGSDDFVAGPLSDPSFEGSSGSDFDMMLLIDRESNQESFPLEYGESMSRDGLFDKEQLYAVYERQDVQRLHFFLGSCLNRAYNSPTPEHPATEASLVLALAKKVQWKIAKTSPPSHVSVQVFRWPREQYGFKRPDVIELHRSDDPQVAHEGHWASYAGRAGAPVEGLQAWLDSLQDTHVGL